MKIEPTEVVVMRLLSVFLDLRILSTRDIVPFILLRTYILALFCTVPKVAAKVEKHGKIFKKKNEKKYTICDIILLKTVCQVEFCEIFVGEAYGIIIKKERADFCKIISGF